MDNFIIFIMHDFKVAIIFDIRYSLYFIFNTYCIEIVADSDRIFIEDTRLEVDMRVSMGV